MKKFISCAISILIVFSGVATCTQDVNSGYVSGSLGYCHMAITHAGEKAKVNHILGILNYKHKNHNDIFVDVKGMYGGGLHGGKHKYKDATDAVDLKTFVHQFGIQGRFGWMFPFGQEEEFGIVPYLGVGYFGDKGSVSKSETLKEKEFYGKIKTHGFYVPVGVLLEWKVVPKFVVGLYTQVEYVFDFKMESRGYKCTNETGPVVEKVSKNYMIKNTFSYFIELPMTYKLTEEWDVFVVPCYGFIETKLKETTSHILHSKASKLHGYSANLGVGYSF